MTTKPRDDGSSRPTFVPLCEQQEDDAATESQPTQQKVCCLHTTCNPCEACYSVLCITSSLKKILTGMDKTHQNIYQRSRRGTIYCSSSAPLIQVM